MVEMIRITEEIEFRDKKVKVTEDIERIVFCENDGSNVHDVPFKHFQCYDLIGLTGLSTKLVGPMTHNTLIGYLTKYPDAIEITIFDRSIVWSMPHYILTELRLTFGSLMKAQTWDAIDQNDVESLYRQQNMVCAEQVHITMRNAK